ncbi:unnamed protein product [Soboliphyme baturini]|uniref:Transmembrane protein n=1 Tax=Soboliphyme baturini TaxID=241478 RepID=A0A183J1A9_9BILA|nr:unnamed protein product [Soboliphyme baturini]
MENQNPAVAVADLVDEADHDFKNCETLFNNYRTKLNELSESQKSCRQVLDKQLQNVVQLKKKWKALRSSPESQMTDTQWASRLEDLQELENRLHFFLSYFPNKSGEPFNFSVYLKIILGDVDVSILDRSAKFRYKDEYEKFKFWLTFISMLLALAAYFCHLRVIDAVFIFFLVWYYCTLTIRESILRCNGSR